MTTRPRRQPARGGGHATVSAAAAASDGGRSVSDASLPILCPVSRGQAEDTKSALPPLRTSCSQAGAPAPASSGLSRARWALPVQLARPPPAAGSLPGTRHCGRRPCRSVRGSAALCPCLSGLHFVHACVLRAVAGGGTLPPPPNSPRPPDEHSLTKGRRNGFVLSIQRSEAGAAGDSFKGGIPRPPQASIWPRDGLHRLTRTW